MVTCDGAKSAEVGYQQITGGGGFKHPPQTGPWRGSGRSVHPWWAGWRQGAPTVLISAGGGTGQVGPAAYLEVTDARVSGSPRPMQAAMQTN